eukprot:5787494-Pyramimonas_sp.AAC.1
MDNHGSLEAFSMFRAVYVKTRGHFNLCDVSLGFPLGAEIQTDPDYDWAVCCGIPPFVSHSESDPRGISSCVRQVPPPRPPSCLGGFWARAHRCPNLCCVVSPGLVMLVMMMAVVM